MELTLQHIKENENTLLWAVVCSLLLHVATVTIVPNFTFEPRKKLEVLKIELAPKPEEIPEPPKPEPPKPIEQPKPELVKKEIKKQPLPPPEVKEVAPIPVVETPQPPPPVMAVAPKVDTPAPVEKVYVPPPPPEPPKETGPTDGEIEAARAAYRSNIERELKRNHKYPRIAEQRGLQGEVKVEISLDSEGNVTNIAVVESSGSSVLDDGAIATVKRSNLKQFMKDILKGKLDTIVVPIRFTLA